MSLPVMPDGIFVDEPGVYCWVPRLATLDESLDSHGGVDELDLEELDEALDRATERRTSVASLGDGSTLHLGLSRNRADGGGGNRTRVPDGPADAAEQDRTRSTDEPRPSGSLTSHKQAGLGAGDDPTPAGGRRAPVDRGQEA